MKVILTSFRDAKNWEGQVWSAARWQPKGSDYPTLDFLAPLHPDTNAKMVHLEPDEFRALYERILENHKCEIQSFFQHRDDEQIVLLCWCHPDRQKQYERLYCHLILLGYYLEEHFPGLEIMYADGRDNPLWEREEDDF